MSKAITPFVKGGEQGTITPFVKGGEQGTITPFVKGGEQGTITPFVKGGRFCASKTGGIYTTRPFTTEVINDPIPILSTRNQRWANST